MTTRKRKRESAIIVNGDYNNDIDDLILIDNYYNKKKQKNTHKKVFELIKNSNNNDDDDDDEINNEKNENAIFVNKLMDNIESNSSRNQFQWIKKCKEKEEKKGNYETVEEIEGRLSNYTDNLCQYKKGMNKRIDTFRDFVNEFGLRFFKPEHLYHILKSLSYTDNLPYKTRFKLFGLILSFLNNRMAPRKYTGKMKRMTWLHSLLTHTNFKNYCRVLIKTTPLCNFSRFIVDDNYIYASDFNDLIGTFLKLINSDEAYRYLNPPKSYVGNVLNSLQSTNGFFGFFLDRSMYDRNHRLRAMGAGGFNGFTRCANVLPFLENLFKNGFNPNHLIASEKTILDMILDKRKDLINRDTPKHKREFVKQLFEHGAVRYERNIEEETEFIADIDPSISRPVFNLKNSCIDLIIKKRIDYSKLPNPSMLMRYKMEKNIFSS